MNNVVADVISWTVWHYSSQEEDLVCCCWGGMKSYISSIDLNESLFYLFSGVGIGGPDYPPWEVCRWKSRNAAEDKNEKPFLDEDYPNIDDNDFLFWCDPFDYGYDFFWVTYKEEIFKKILVEKFSEWAKENPARNNEFSIALAKYGMELKA